LVVVLASLEGRSRGRRVREVEREVRGERVEGERGEG
jgi:hypothetical protein